MHSPGLPNKDDHWPHSAVLVVDDEPGMRSFLVKSLAPRCRHVASAASVEDAQVELQRQRYDLLVLDISLPGRDGISWLRELREQGYSGEVVLITAFADLDTAIEALRAGASDFILKPFRLTQILNAVRQSLERSRLKRENWVLRRNSAPRGLQRDAIVGDSVAMHKLRDTLERLAAVDSTVLLSGESGTGKELAAQALHRQSPRAQAPFVPVNCAALSAERLEAELFGHAPGAFDGARQARDGLLYYAQGGTLFLDEVAELPAPIQAALLRVLEDRQVRPVGSSQLMPVDVRIVAATHRRLADEVAAGRFRKDLYYRLQVVEVALPPLREHKDDIPALVTHFNRLLAPQLGADELVLGGEDLAFLRQYAWPGNVRELRNLMERSLILGQLNVSALYPGGPPATAAPGEPLPTDLHELEKRHILAVLESVGGDKTRAAQLLGVSRRTLERRTNEWTTRLG
jgi:DNA-binding NtrC family response regulator